VTDIALAGIASGADGLEIEVHHQPAKAKSDGLQSLTPKRFVDLMARARRVAAAVDRVRARLDIQAQAAEPAVLPRDSQIESLLALLKNAQAVQPARIVVEVQNRLLLIDQSEICYAAIDDGVIRIATRTFEGCSRCRTLEELMEQLDPARFWRAHRGFVVNIGHIREVVPWFKSSYQLRMDDKQQTEIPVSRAQTKRLKELFFL